MLPKGQYDLNSYYRPRECVICLELFKDQAEVTYLPCDPRHHFHTACIETWLYNYLKCPICNSEVTLESVKKCGEYNELVDFVKQKDEESFLSSRRSTYV